MDAGVLETAFLQAQETVGRQGDIVRSLKAQLKDGKVERVSQCGFGILAVGHAIISSRSSCCCSLGDCLAPRP